MKRLLSVFLSVVLVAPFIGTKSSSVLPTSRVEATSSQTVDYAFTGQLETFTVPNGVFSFVVSLSGASGGIADVNGGGSPGRGGFLSVSVTATPGEVYKIGVGQQGEGFTVGVTPNIPMAGGWPNGGDGYIAPQGGNNGIGFGAGGGAATSLYKVINNSNTLVAIAGGGGGAGGLTNGGGGGTTGGSTFSVVVPFDISRENTGGTQNAGGVGACVDEDGNATSDVCNGDGASLAGGDAGVNTYGGGGGGGGYFGGGAGMGHGGGAGGSTWWNSSVVTRTNDQTGVRLGDGVASITYTPAVPCQAGSYSGTGFEPCVLASAGYFVNVSGATSQTPCPSGYTSTSSGSIQCDPIATSSTSSTSTTTPPTVVPVGVTTPTTTLPSTSTTVPLKTCTTTSGKAISRSCLATNARIVLASSSKISIVVSKASAKVCRMVGTNLRTTKKGSCSVTMSVTPKGGKKKSYKVKISVTK